MKITSYSIFPHPVLYETDEINQDYQFGTFESEITTYIKDNDKVGMVYTINLNQDYLISLLKNKKAKCGILVTANNTFYNELIEVIKVNSECDHVFEEGVLWGEVKFLPIIYSIESNPNYKPKDLHDDYTGIDIEIDKGSILAIGEETTENFINKYPIDTCFNLRKNSKIEPGEIVFDISGSFINIDVNEDQYNEINRLLDSAQGEIYATHALIIPSIMYSLSEVKLSANEGDGNTDESFGEHLWYNQFKEVLIKSDIEIGDPNMDIFEVSQILMKSGKKRIYSNLYDLEELMDGLD
tara:strand:+ start:1182 stop:2072 length:891 start_codon:yes stop_codon:yes gene_type:complete